MFEAISAKVFATVVSLSMFLFSSYTGNDPAFSALNSKVGESYLQLNTSLISAFDNDFPDVFKSGAKIPVDFTVKIKSGRRTLSERKFQNSVQFDPTKGLFTVYSAGMNRSIQTASYQQMIAGVSDFECSIPYRSNWGQVHISVEATLPTIRFAQINKPVDLMVLWRYQHPKVNTSIVLRSVS